MGLRKFLLSSSSKLWRLQPKLVVMEAVNKPRNVAYKGLTYLVTDTNKSSEEAILEVVRKNFNDHLILGEEEGLLKMANC